jgi:hypothetical protein
MVIKLGAALRREKKRLEAGPKKKRIKAPSASELRGFGGRGF